MEDPGAQDGSDTTMEPFAHADTAMLATLDGVVFDVDDTITRGGRIERDAFDALVRLGEAGLTRVAVTGRPLGWADVMARQLPVDLVVGENGAGWVAVVEGTLVEGYFDDVATRTRHAALLENVVERVARELPDVVLANDQRARRCDAAFDVGETRTLDAPTLAALFGILEDAGMKTPVPVSTVHAHAIPGSWDKAEGVSRALGDVLGVPKEDVRTRYLFVGDSGNDAEAFAWFTHTVGVSNVRDHLARLPHRPRFVTASDRGRGFAEVVERLLAARAR